MSVVYAAKTLVPGWEGREASPFLCRTTTIIMMLGNHSRWLCPFLVAFNLMSNVLAQAPNLKYLMYLTG